MKNLTAKIRRCRNGHRQTKENIYVRPDGYKACRECMLAADKRYRERLAQNNHEWEMMNGMDA